ncbi:SDR family oxidoreductase [Pedobacter sp. Leaf176]|uniref:SDR family oxidoreductase n=1 Tax=Pedobacter sp. Leaf176 TaxID=1736286 RepID=UPI0006FB7E0A|nr:SDR family oxidoreductase [Pedobacter sp. Leaf176]KQR67702.1 epimerase [Pedobacter sp. Leaf176]
MKILLTGANGYIGTRLLPLLLEEKHEIVCLVRDKRRFATQSDLSEQVTIISGDLLEKESLSEIPVDIDAAYYLVHSMSSGGSEFDDMERQSSSNFASAIKKTNCKQIIYLTGIANDEHLSKHLGSRLAVEEELKSSGLACTILRAAIIIGSGSASFEIIRDLTEKIPVMVTPKWVDTKCQPIGIRDVLAYLIGVLHNEKAYRQTFDIGGPDILTYKEMMFGYAKERGLKRWIFTVPVLTPRLSSLWLNMITPVPYSLARSLVDSMKNEVICKDDRIKDVVPRECLTYAECLHLAFEKIDQNSIVSSWKDALNRGYLRSNFMDQIKVPQNGTLEYKVKMPFERKAEEVFENIWSIGGNRGWYYMDWLWHLRGFLDKMFGGVGTRRGRTSNVDIQPGDVLDFWRVLLADKESKRLLLYAEMKVPGEAWLELKLLDFHGKAFLSQVATFRPKGLWGRMYWYAMWPFHIILFKGMAKQITTYRPVDKKRI